MGLFIKGVDLPKEGFTQIFVFPNGETSVFKYFSILGKPEHQAVMERNPKTIEVPDEIDAQTLRKILEENANGDSSSQLS